MFVAIVAASAMSLFQLPPFVATVVAVNEALYRDLDVSYTAVYRHATARKGVVPQRQGGEGGIVLESVKTTRVVLQKEMYRVDGTERADIGDVEPVTRSFGHAFDGEKTRSREGQKMTATDGRDTPRNYVHFPHLWATAPFQENFALSDFIAASEKWGRVPGRVSFFNKNSTLSTTFGGNGTVGGESCVIIRCKLSNPNLRTETTFSYWLAVGKNYIPVRTEKCERSLSETLPIETVECREFKEIKPGVWLPYRLTRTVFDETKLPGGRQIVINTTETTIDKAILGPKLDKEFFRELAPKK
jgi:hypothetical protein